MTWSRRHALIAGLALIAITNSVALGGVAYNRSGEADSTLTLGERELQPAFPSMGGKENSGLTLELEWRVLQDVTPRSGVFYFGGHRGGTPAWLDAQKMASLGFDTTLSAEGLSDSRDSPYRRQLPRDVLIVLELDGPTHAQALERTLQAARDVESRNERGEGKKAVAAMLDNEARSSRLFAVDAGLDHAALRTKFPDRTRYAIVHGRVRPSWFQGSKAGLIESLDAASINVPLEMRGALEGVVSRSYGLPAREAKRFEARLAFGRRLEPWLLSATQK
jgi:hypothetical protein